MARSNTKHYGLLARWADVMHEDIWRFNQITGQGVTKVAGCSSKAYLQYERDMIARELHGAFTLSREYLGFPPAPQYIVDEIVPVKCDFHWKQQTYELKYGETRAFGKRATALIQANVSVAYSDTDDDQVDDLATVTVTTSHPADEIQVFFRVTDGASSAAHESWRIEPLVVTKNGTTATITGHRANFVSPALWSDEYSDDHMTANAGDVESHEHFVTAVDVYRVYTDATSAVTLLLSPDEADSYEVAATAYSTDAHMGYFRLYTADSQTAPAATPHAVRVSYLAGLPLANGYMDNELEPLICRYANTRMNQVPPVCDVGQRMYNEDRAVPESTTQFQTWYPPPFGITNAGQRLWSVIQARRSVLKGRRELGR